MEKNASPSRQITLILLVKFQHIIFTVHVAALKLKCNLLKLQMFIKYTEVAPWRGHIPWFDAYSLNAL